MANTRKVANAGTTSAANAKNISITEETRTGETSFGMDISQMMDLISKLSAQVEQLKKEKEENKHTEYVRVADMDKPCTLIHLCECNPALPTTIKLHGNEIRFTKFGERRTFRFSEMQDITSRYRRWFERGIFTLGEDCDEFKNSFDLSIMDMPMPVEKHNKIASLPINEFKQIVNSLSENQALFLAKTWVDRYYDNKPGYGDIEKIRILNKKTNGFMKEFLNNLLDEE